jgi:hypothetical protein
LGPNCKGLIKEEKSALMPQLDLRATVPEQIFPGSGSAQATMLNLVNTGDPGDFCVWC